MKFPQFLYRMLPGDAGSQSLEAAWREVTSSATAATVSADAIVVPGDKCLVLTNVAMTFTPGAGQNCTRQRVMADPPAGTTRYDIIGAQTGGALARALNWQGEVVIPPLWKVKVEGVFDAAVNANTVNAEIHGFLIPRGTFVF